MVKSPPADARDLDERSIPESGTWLGGGHDNPLHYPCLEKPMHREAWWAIIHRVTKSQTPLKRLGTHASPLS